MARFVAPFLFLVAGAVVWWFNAEHVDRALVFPFLPSLIPSLEGDVDLQGKASAGLLFAIGALLLASALWRNRPDRFDEGEP